MFSNLGRYCYRAATYVCKVACHRQTVFAGLMAPPTETTKYGLYEFMINAFVILSAARLPRFVGLLLTALRMAVSVDSQLLPVTYTCPKGEEIIHSRSYSPLIIT